MQKETFCDFINCSLHSNLPTYPDQLEIKNGKYYCTQKGARWCWYLTERGKYYEEEQMYLRSIDKRTQLQVVAALVKHLTKKRHSV